MIFHFFHSDFGNEIEVHCCMKNGNSLKVLTLVKSSFRKWIGLGLLFFSALSSANSETISELSLRYRMMSNDYHTSGEVLDSVFENFLKTQIYWSHSSAELNRNKAFLMDLQKFSVSMNQFIGSQSNIEQKKNSLEALITLLSESSQGNDRLEKSLPKIYNDFLKSMMASTAPATIDSSDDYKPIRVKTNEVIKTIGTYGIWGFWFVTSTAGIMALSPTMEHFLYYPAVAMFLASGPYSITNQIWGQVFDRLEKKADLQHKTAVQYMKDKIRSLKYFKRNKIQQCLKFYQTN